MLKSERLKLVIELLTTQINHWAIFPPLMAVFGFFMGIAEKPLEGEPDLLLWAVCGLLPVVLFLLRSRVERRWLFLLCNGAVLAAAGGIVLAVYLSGAFSAVIFLYTICAAVYIFYSVEVSFSETPSLYSDCIKPVPAAILSAAAVLLFHIEEGIAHWDRYCVFILLGILVCHMIIYYLKHYLDFLQISKSSAGYLPAGQILHGGMFYVLICALLGVLVLFLHMEWLEELFGGVWEWLKALFSAVRDTPSAGMAPEERLPMEESGGYGLGGGAMIPIEIKDPLWIWDALEYVAVVALVCGGVYVLVKGVKKLFRFLKGRSGRSAAGENVVIMDEDCFDIKEKCGIEKRVSGGKGAGLFRRASLAEKMRRLYKRRVLSGWTDGRDRKELNYMTAKECGEALALPDMAKLYEKARYSEREVTGEDMRQMKAAAAGRSPFRGE